MSYRRCHKRSGASAAAICNRDACRDPISCRCVGIVQKLIEHFQHAGRHFSRRCPDFVDALRLAAQIAAFAGLPGPQVLHEIGVRAKSAKHPPIEPIFDGEAQAQLIALACCRRIARGTVYYTAVSKE